MHESVTLLKRRRNLDGTCKWRQSCIEAVKPNCNVSVVVAPCYRDLRDISVKPPLCVLLFIVKETSLTSFPRPASGSQNQCNIARRHFDNNGIFFRFRLRVHVPLLTSAPCVCVVTATASSQISWVDIHIVHTAGASDHSSMHIKAVPKHIFNSRNSPFAC